MYFSSLTGDSRDTLFISITLIMDHPQSAYTVRGREVVKAKVCIYCFYDVILLF